MPETAYNSRLHRFAASTVCVAMITLVAGALVTSKNAGMAFPDWPTSDGQGMLTYPWLADFARNWDKFLEHGHRLAGMLIGIWSIGLVVLVMRAEQRPWVRLLAVAILCGVILQGVLGGLRVWLDERGLAMLHGAFAACVFSLMGIIVTSLSPGWHASPTPSASGNLTLAKSMAAFTAGLLAIQYLLGGLIRHQGTALFEHLGLGVFALFAVLANSFIAHRSGNSWIRRSGWLLLAVVLLQIALGAAAWVSRFGLGSVGYVAVADSLQQIAFRTAHTVTGILLFMTAVIHLVRVFRISHCHHAGRFPVSGPGRASALTAGSLSATGGAL